MTMTWLPVKNIKALKRYLAQLRKLYHVYGLNIDSKQLVREFKAVLRHVPRPQREGALMLLTLSLEENEMLSRDQCELLPHLVLREMSKYATICGPKGTLHPYDCTQLKSWWPWHADTANLHCQAVLAMVDPFTGKRVSLNAKNDYKDITAMHAVTRAVEPMLRLHCHRNNPKPEQVLCSDGLYSARLPREYERKSALNPAAAKALTHRGQAVAENLAQILSATSLETIREEATARNIDAWTRLGQLLRHNNACLRAWGRGYCYSLDGHVVAASDLLRRRPDLKQWSYANLVREFGRPGWDVLGKPVEEQKAALAVKNAVAKRLPEVHQRLQQLDRDSVLFVLERSLCRLPADEAYLQAMDHEGQIRHRCKIKLDSVQAKSQELLRWEAAGLDVTVSPIPPKGLSFIARHQLSAEEKDRLVADFPPSVIIRAGPKEYSLLFVAKDPTNDAVRNRVAARAWSLALQREYGGSSEPRAGIGFAVAGLARTASDGFSPRLLFATHVVRDSVTEALQQSHEQVSRREREFFRGKPGEALRIIQQLQASEDEKALTPLVKLYAAHLDRIAAAAEVCLTATDRDERIACGLMRGGKTEGETREILEAGTLLIIGDDEVKKRKERLSEAIEKAVAYVTELGTDPELRQLHRSVELKHTLENNSPRSTAPKQLQPSQKQTGEQDVIGVHSESFLCQPDETEWEKQKRKQRRLEFDRRRREALEAEQAILDAQWLMAEELIAPPLEEYDQHRLQYEQWLAGRCPMPTLLAPLLALDPQAAIKRGKLRAETYASLEKSDALVWQELLDLIATYRQNKDKLLHHALQLQRAVHTGRITIQESLDMQRHYNRDLHVYEGEPQSAEMTANRGGHWAK